MQSFGRYLAERHVLSPEQLSEATQSLVLYGGRLGTNLVELGHLELEELELHLSEHQGIPIPPAEWLERPSAEALKAVPASLVQRHRILPMELEDRTLHVAMADPRDANQLNDVAFATGLDVRSYLLSEIRLSFLLDRHFGVPPDVRYLSLGPQVGREQRKKAEDRLGWAEPWAEAEVAAHQRDILGIGPLEGDQELIDEGAFDALHGSWQIRQESPAEGRAGGADLPPGTSARAFALEANLAEAPGRDGVNEAALGLARLYARAASIFVVHRNVIRGACSAIDGSDDSIEGVFVPCGARSLLAEVASTGEVYRGPPPQYDIDEWLLRTLGRTELREVAVYPVKIRDRVVNLLYVDNGPDLLGETSFAALSALCGCIEEAYRRLILERRQEHC